MFKKTLFASCLLLTMLFIPSMCLASGINPFRNAPIDLPEPMIFDLALPLGSARYDYEFNTLVQYDFEGNAVKMNPEFEFAFANGYSIELELPMENTAVEAYKFALQGTFSFLNTKKFIHGWQYYGEYIKHTKEIENNLFYVFGYEFNDKWSTLNMLGLRLTDFSAHGHAEKLINSNLFYSFTKDLIAGVEINWESRPNRPDTTLVMPQMHVKLTKQAKIQFGFGMKRMGDEHFPHAATRVIYRH
ncbi:MAG: hypothetical protein MRK00_09920 [Nitrosomonas sp.]|nr:hypothetical protein [Nitrosomonas sp.]